MLPAQTPIRSSTFDASMKSGLEAATPFVQGSQALKQMGEDEQRKQQAIAYRQLLHSGADGMRKYAQEVGNEFPDLGSQLGAEAEQYATFLQDPSLDAAKAEEYTHHFYESANNRVKAIKDTKEAAVKPWEPTTMEEAVKFDRSKRENEADFRADPAPLAADRTRAEKRMNALRKIPSMWKQIEEMQRSGGEVPLIPGKAEPDVRAYEDTQPKAWKEKWNKLRGELNKYEADAGLEASTDIMGPGRDSSASYKIYTSGAGSPAASSGSTPSPAAPAKSQSAVDSALQWVKDVKAGRIKDKKDKKFPNGRLPDIIEQLKTSGVDTSGL
jgi:hypothetical protein